MRPKDIENIRRILSNWHDLNYQIHKENTIRELLTHIDEQTSQIATLKAALEKDRFWARWQTGKYNSIVAATRAATTQLVKEYPEINWEE